MIEAGTTETPNRVSGRFLTDLFRALDRQGLPARELLGDLPVVLGEDGEVTEAVEWDHFVEFMRRLGRALGGPSEIEQVASRLGPLKPAKALASLAGLGASPYSLYRAASGWVLRRAMPGVEATLTRADDGQLEIHARIADGLRPCPELFRFAAGGARVLPRAIGLPDAVVVAEIGEREARYRIAVPPSTTLLARLGRVLRTIFSAGDVLRFLEAQQLELHAKNDALRQANDALAESERRYRALVDTAVDVLCEIDPLGRVVYVSASVENLIGYSPSQVTGSHYRLWIPREWHERVDEVVNALLDLPTGRATQELIRLHGADSDPVFAELTARTYLTSDGDRRIVCILRDQTDRAPIANTRQEDVRAHDEEREVASHELREIVERTLGDAPGLSLDPLDATHPLDDEEKDETVVEDEPL